MAHDDHGAIKEVDGFLEYNLALYVQVVGWLIQNEAVAWTHQ